MKCPRCGLINPQTAQRCDCGYDFETKTVEESYYKQALPGWIRSFLILLTLYNLTLGVLALVSRDWRAILAAIAWSAGIWFLYFRLKKKSASARLGLAILTFPLGLFLFLSREVRLYFLQRD